MALKTLVKLSNVNNLSDARYGAGMGVTLMGFNFSTDHRSNISATTFKEITDWISGVQLVAEFDKETAAEIKSLLQGVKVDFIQTSSVETAKALADEAEGALILRIETLTEAEIGKTIDEAKAFVTYFLLENEHNAAFSADFLNKISKQSKVIIGSGIEKSNLSPLLEVVKPAGIALKGGDEIRPGLKDFDEIAEILEALEIEG